MEIIIGLPIALVLAPALYWHITPITLLSICESEEEQELRKSQLSEDTGIAQPQPRQEDSLLSRVPNAPNSLTPICRQTRSVLVVGKKSLSEIPLQEAHIKVDGGKRVAKKDVTTS